VEVGVTEPAHKLRIRNLRKTYGPVVALAGADLEVNAASYDMGGMTLDDALEELRRLIFA